MYKVIKYSMRGGIWFLQVKRGRGDHKWHPHLHIVADSDYIDKQALSLAWLQATGNSYIIDIRSIKNESEVADYVARYSSLPCRLTDFTKADRVEIATVLHGVRLSSCFGTGRKCHIKRERLKGTPTWEQLGNWSDFINNRPFDESIQKILHAWFNDESIERSVCKDFIHQEITEPTTITRTNNVLREYQLYIDDFVHR